MTSCCNSVFFANPFILHLFAALSEKKRKLIGSRTKAALAALKAKVAQFGNRTNLSEAQSLGQTTNAVKAAAFAAKILPAIRLLHAQHMTMAQIAAELNERGTRTSLDGVWHQLTVSRLLKAGTAKINRICLLNAYLEKFGVYKQWNQNTESIVTNWFN